MKELIEALASNDVEAIEEKLFNHLWKDSYLVNEDAKKVMMEHGWTHSTFRGDCDSRGTEFKKDGVSIIISG